MDWIRWEPVGAECANNITVETGVSGERKIDRWLNQHRLAVAYFRDKPEVFLNVNNPDDRKALESKLGEKP